VKLNDYHIKEKQTNKSKKTKQNKKEKQPRVGCKAYFFKTGAAFINQTKVPASKLKPQLLIACSSRKKKQK